MQHSGGNQAHESPREEADLVRKPWHAPQFMLSQPINGATESAYHLAPVDVLSES